MGGMVHQPANKPWQTMVFGRPIPLACVEYIDRTPLPEEQPVCRRKLRSSRVFESWTDGLPTMTGPLLENVDVSSASAFEAVLAEAVERAIKADVEVRGAWEFQTRGSTHHWEVEIYELAKENGE